jgi:type II secretory pathway pseudopilin PulG
VKRPRSRRARGFILVDALVSVALAALTGAVAVTLLVWTARSLDRSQARLEAAALVERLYEEARLASPDDLSAAASGQAGRYRWRRLPLGLVDRPFGAGPQRIRLEVAWRAGGQPQSSHVEAWITGGGS